MASIHLDHKIDNKNHIFSLIFLFYLERLRLIPQNIEEEGTAFQAQVKLLHVKTKEEVKMADRQKIYMLGSTSNLGWPVTVL